ncbi:MAG TPA: hypothetical protein VMZ31_11570 [Phycisphaerae bacterium]|nr:hypothetical protein [Phycisphaerae bacterium]
MFAAALSLSVALCAAAVPPASPALDLLVLQADVIGLGSLTKQLESVTLLSDRGRPAEYLTAELTLTAGVKCPSQWTTVRAVVAEAGDAGHHLIKELLGQERLWLLRKEPGTDLYRADLEAERLSPERRLDVERTLEYLDRNLSCGQPNDGLQACAAWSACAPHEEGQPELLLFAVENVSEKPVRLGTHPYQTRLRLVDATGKPLPLSLYKWLKRARIRPPGKDHFLQIDPGQVLVINQRGAGIEPLTLPPGTLTGRNTPIRVELSASDDGASVGLEDVWTGSVVSGAVGSSPPTTAPASPAPD